MKITAKYLKTLSPCPKEFRKFKKLFPDGAEPTMDNLLLAHDSGLNVMWFGPRGLLGRAYNDYMEIAYPASTKYWKEIDKLHDDGELTYQGVADRSDVLLEDYMEMCICHLFFVLQTI